MGKAINPVVIGGTIMGSCPKCGQPYLGSFDVDAYEAWSNNGPNVNLECVACGHKGKYFVLWPDDLPQVLLRHKKNRQLLKTKTKRKTKSLDERNQLKLFK